MFFSVNFKRLQLLFIELRCFILMTNVMTNTSFSYNNHCSGEVVINMTIIDGFCRMKKYGIENKKT